MATYKELLKRHQEIVAEKERNLQLKATLEEKGVVATGHWTGYSYMGKIPDGTWMEFDNEEEYLDFLKEW